MHDNWPSFFSTNFIAPLSGVLNGVGQTSIALVEQLALVFVDPPDDQDQFIVILTPWNVLKSRS
jgi:hypothetical protein